MSIWEYANPKKFMQTSTLALPWISGLAVVLLVVGLVWGGRVWQWAVTRGWSVVRAGAR